MFAFSATFFSQNGVAGACGTVHADSDFITAIGMTRTPFSVTLQKIEISTSQTKAVTETSLNIQHFVEKRLK